MHLEARQSGIRDTMLNTSQKPFFYHCYFVYKMHLRMKQDLQIVGMKFEGVILVQLLKSMQIVRAGLVFQISAVKSLQLQVLILLLQCIIQFIRKYSISDSSGSQQLHNVKHVSAELGLKWISARSAEKEIDYSKQSTQMMCLSTGCLKTFSISYCLKGSHQSQKDSAGCFWTTTRFYGQAAFLFFRSFFFH